MDILITILSGVVVSMITYILARRKNESEANLNDAGTKKNLAEAHKLDVENKLLQVELFDKLNQALSEQNEKLLQSNEKLSKSNEILIKQNKQLLRQISSLEDRIEAIEGKLEVSECINATTCESRNITKDGDKTSKEV